MLGYLSGASNGMMRFHTVTEVRGANRSDFVVKDPLPALMEEIRTNLKTRASCPPRNDVGLY
jgi:hypothetical protein